MTNASDSDSTPIVIKINISSGKMFIIRKKLYPF